VPRVKIALERIG